MIGPMGNPLLDPTVVAEKAGMSLNYAIPESPGFISKLDIHCYSNHMNMVDDSMWTTYFSDPELTWEYRMGSDRSQSGNKFFIHPLKNNPWMSMLYSQLEAVTGLPLTSPENILDVYLNGQVMGQDGGRHVDTEKLQPWWSVLYFPMPWEEKWGGSTKFFRSNLDLLLDIPVKQGNILVFPGNLIHQGTAPIVPNVMRMSLAIKTRMRFDVFPVTKR
jgi:hypothetical protein